MVLEYLCVKWVMHEFVCATKVQKVLPRDHNGI